MSQEMTDRVNRIEILSWVAVGLGGVTLFTSAYSAYKHYNED